MEFEKIRSIIANQLDLDVESITQESRLIEDLKADSLDVVELIMDLEQEFSMEIPEEDIAKVKTVGDILQFVSK